MEYSIRFLIQKGKEWVYENFYVEHIPYMRFQKLRDQIYSSLI